MLHIVLGLFTSVDLLEESLMVNFEDSCISITPVVSSNPNVIKKMDGGLDNRKKLQNLKNGASNTKSKKMYTYYIRTYA